MSQNARLMHFHITTCNYAPEELNFKAKAAIMQIITQYLTKCH